MAGLPRRSSTGDFQIATQNFMAGKARRALEAHDAPAADGAEPLRRADGRRRKRTAQLTQARLAAAFARRGDGSPPRPR